MNATFPIDQDKKRKALLNAVEEVRDICVAGAEEAEINGTLPEATVDALEQSGLLAMKLPNELGGAEADPVTQLQVIEATTRIDPATGWVMMIGAASIASPAVFLPDEAISQMGGRLGLREPWPDIIGAASCHPHELALLWCRRSIAA